MRAPAAYQMRSAALIRDLDAAIQVPAAELVRRAYAAGIPIVIASGRRPFTAQAALYNQGRVSPGDIVTNVRPGESLHETGLAFDVAPLDPHAASGMGDVLVPWPDEPAFWRILGRIGEELGLVWGGRFPKPDFPHFQARS